MITVSSPLISSEQKQYDNKCRWFVRYSVITQISYEMKTMYFVTHPSQFDIECPHSKCCCSGTFRQEQYTEVILVIQIPIFNIRRLVVHLDKLKYML